MGLDFDFEGSSVEGVEASFRGWGGQLRPFVRGSEDTFPVGLLAMAAIPILEETPAPGRELSIETW